GPAAGPLPLPLPPPMLVGEFCGAEGPELVGAVWVGADGAWGCCGVGGEGSSSQPGSTSPISGSYLLTSVTFPSPSITTALEPFGLLIHRRSSLTNASKFS